VITNEKSDKENYPMAKTSHGCSAVPARDRITAYSFNPRRQANLLVSCGLTPIYTECEIEMVWNRFLLTTGVLEGNSDEIPPRTKNSER
jgi:hypothetical protein